MSTLYTAVATVTGGREGHGATSDGKVEVDLSIPKELGGSGGPGTNPEQLFAIAYSACFLGAVRFVADLQKKDVGEASVTGEVSVNTDNGGWKLSVELHCKLPGVSKPEAEDIVAQAHEKICPYSKATRGNVDVTLMVE